MRSLRRLHSLGTARPLVLTDEGAEAIQRKLAEGWRGPVPLRSLEQAARYGLQKVRRVLSSRELERFGEPRLERHVEPLTLPAEVMEGDATVVEAPSVSGVPEDVNRLGTANGPTYARSRSAVLMGTPVSDRKEGGHLDGAA